MSAREHIVFEEEKHPRWGARTSNPEEGVHDVLGEFDSHLFRPNYASFSFARPGRDGACKQAADLAPGEAGPAGAVARAVAGTHKQFGEGCPVQRYDAGRGCVSVTNDKTSGPEQRHDSQHNRFTGSQS